MRSAETALGPASQLTFSSPTLPLGLIPRTRLNKHAPAKLSEAVAQRTQTATASQEMRARLSCYQGHIMLCLSQRPSQVFQRKSAQIKLGALPLVTMPTHLDFRYVGLKRGSNS